MTVHDFMPPPHRTDEGVLHPELQRLVSAARAQRAPAVHVKAEEIHAGWQQRRAAQRRVVGLGLAAAAALVLAVSTLGPRLWRDRVDAPLAQHDVASPAGAGAEATPPAPDAPPEVPAVEPSPEPTVLAASIHVAPLETTEARPQVLGPRHLRLPQGHWSIDSEAPELVVVELPEGSLELRGGSVHVEVAGSVAHVEVVRDQVVRVTVDGQRRTLSAPPLEPTTPAEPTRAEPTRAAGPSAAELAREAEEHLAAGDRQGAIRSLRRLVLRHGRSAPAQAGLIDLGRLLKAAGQTDQARCAYALFLERWPAHALAGDVAKAQRALGEGPACDGLKPTR